MPLRGGAKLQIILRAPAYDINTGHPTFASSSPELGAVEARLTVQVGANPWPDRV